MGGVKNLPPTPWLHQLSFAEKWMYMKYTFYSQGAFMITTLNLYQQCCSRDQWVQDQDQDEDFVIQDQDQDQDFLVQDQDQNQDFLVRDQDQDQDQTMIHYILLINYANMQISMTGKLYVNVLGHSNTLTKVQVKIL